LNVIKEYEMNEKEITTMDVIVHKATIALRTGESLGVFTRELSRSSREHIMKKLNIAKGSGGAWDVEVFGDKVVMAAYKDGDATKYYAFKYTRDKVGNFEFGDTVEVERITSFKPKSGMSITKGKKKKEEMETEEEVEEKGCSGGRNTKKALGEQTFGGWRETNKSFWTNVL
jgi:hypothetical protein